MVFVALLLMGVSAYSFRPGQEEGLPLGVGAALLGGVALSLALRYSSAADTLSTPTLAAAPTDATHRWGALALAAVCWFLLAESNGDLLHLPLISNLSQHLQFGLFAAGIVLWVWGFGGLAQPRLDKYLVVITLLALLVRLWALEDAVHFFVDETNFVDAVIRLNNEDQTRLLTPFDAVAAFTWVYPYLQTITTDLFGHSLTGLRMVSVVFGTLTVPALYLLARTLFDRKTALLAALFLATFPPHVHLSRLGLNNIADPLFGTLALAFLVRGAKTQRPGDYVLAGAALGLTQYFYEGGRLLFLGLVIVCLLGMAVTKRLRWRAAALLLLIAAITAAPLYYTYLAHHLPVVPRLNSNIWDNRFWASLLLASKDDPVLHFYLVRQISYPLLHLIHRPDDSGFYYGGVTPLILGYLVPAFLLGIVYALRRRPAAAALLLTWILFTVLGNSLLRWNEYTPRFAVVFPALCLLIAVGVRYTLPVRPWMIGALALALAVPQLVYYFGPHLDLYNRQIREYHDHQDVLYRAAQFPPGTFVHIISGDLVWTPHLETLKRFWNLDIAFRALSSDEFIREGLSDLPSGRDHAFFIEPGNIAAMNLLRQRLNLEGPPQWSPYNVPRERQYVLLYYHPPG